MLQHSPQMSRGAVTGLTGAPGGLATQLACTPDSLSRSYFLWALNLSSHSPSPCSVRALFNVSRNCCGPEKPSWHSNSNQYSGFPGNAIFQASKNLCWVLQICMRVPGTVSHRCWFHPGPVIGNAGFPASSSSNLSDMDKKGATPPPPVIDLS